jgi:hypothetical protein
MSRSGWPFLCGKQPSAGQPDAAARFEANQASIENGLSAGTVHAMSHGAVFSNEPAAVGR